jgi:diamine N-acetyltransferase
MYKIFILSENDIQAIIALAHETWLATYVSLISIEQINFMLETFYDPSLLSNQLNDYSNHFFGVKNNTGTLLAYAHVVAQESKMKLTKLYVSPMQHKKGIGIMLINEVEKMCKQKKISLLELCVNKGNPARFFYEKMGFKIMCEEDFPIGNFWMNDYVMEKIII